MALVLGSLIGAERQWRHHMAGLQTNALVAVGAASFVLISVQVTGDSSSLGRIAAQVASGIGFLGAGVIMRQGLNVYGLNSAATLWCSAAVGTLAGAGALVPAVLATLFVGLANLLLHPLVALINRQRLPTAIEAEVDYELSLTCVASDETRIRALLFQGAGGLALHGLESRRETSGDRVALTAIFQSFGRDDQAIERVVTLVCLEPSIATARWRIVPRAFA